MKSCISILALLMLLCSCSKKVEPNIITQNAAILYSNTGKWQLNIYSANFVIQPLTLVQSSFVKCYTSDSKFSDTDGLNGTWTLPSPDALVENYTNFSSGILVTQKYKINTLSTTQLNVTYVVNGTEITANYKAIP
jgi:hypothetical protein